MKYPVHYGCLALLKKQLLHGDEGFICDDAGYQGVEKREELKDRKVEWLIAERPGKSRASFRIIKCQFGFIKARYKGLMKNDSQLAILFTLANLFKVD